MESGPTQILLEEESEGWSVEEFQDYIDSTIFGSTLLSFEDLETTKIVWYGWLNMNGSLYLVPPQRLFG